MNTKQLKGVIALTTLQFEAAMVAGKSAHRVNEDLQATKRTKVSIGTGRNFLMKKRI
jgi:hypothetical protein